MATNASTLSIFDAAYWASQPPQVAALNTLPVDCQNPTPTGRTNTAMALATQGFTIDGQIMLWGWDPYLVMSMRQMYGYPWVPSVLMPPITLAPGITQPGSTPYNPANPPKGAIMVSTNPANYPPFVTTPPVTPASEPTSLVGASEGAGYYQAYPQAVSILVNGQTYTADPRGTFTFHTSPSPFAPGGVTAWFTINT